jgi:ParB-like chromosome segregation protein Spo0J
MREFWPADAVERRPVASLTPYLKNARTHSEAQIRQIAESIREFGFTVPVLIDEGGNLIAGHGRVLAAVALGLVDVPAMVARGWTEQQIRAYRIADNKLALNSDWDFGLLAIELEELAGMESLIGFSEDELIALFKGEQAPATITPAEAHKKLSERFGIPPFTVLNAREGWWQDRKRAWIGLGIQSELGRGEPAAEPGPDGYRKTASEEQFTKTRFTRAGPQTASLKGGKTVHTTADPYRKNRKTPAGVVAGNGWDGGVARRDAAFYNKKRAWEKANGRKISTTEFRENYWGGQ